MIEDSANLWRTLVGSAGLDLDGYDEPLVEELATNLGLSPLAFVDLSLLRDVDADILLVEFLSLVTPFAKMMTDILAFFAKAGAKASNDNLRVRFNFSRDSKAFEFDLRAFQDWERQYREVFETVEMDEIDDIQAFEIRHAFVEEGTTYSVRNASVSEPLPENKMVREWLEASRFNGDGNSSMPPPPSVANDELRSLLFRVWRFLRASYDFTRSDSGKGRLSSSDVATIVRGAYLLQKREKVLLDRLEKVFKSIPAHEIVRTEVIEELIQVFNLPVWKRRSEFYSIWVGTRLISSFGDRCRVHAVDQNDQTLVFSFAGTHLATVDASMAGNLHIWCELRTAATSALLGKGRKTAIQPDYVVLREPTSETNSAILVVECKQYKKQSRENFSNAIIDYGRTHLNARIVLVNYGPITQTVLERVSEVDPLIVNRVSAIGALRPGSAGALQQFVDLVEPFVPEQSLSEGSLPETVSSTEVSGFGCLYLSWLEDVDLDIHCWITDAENNQIHVYFEHPRGMLGGSTAELEDDIRTGGEAEESIKWHCSQTASIEVAVHSFSETSIHSAQPSARIRVGGQTWIVEPEASQRGVWWRLLRISSGGAEIRLINQLSDTAPSSEFSVPHRRSNQYDQ